MLATGCIDIVSTPVNHIYVIELRLTKKGGVSSAAEQIKASGYIKPLLAGKRSVIAHAVELDDMDIGLVEVMRKE